MSKPLTNTQARRIKFVWVRWSWSFTFRRPYQVMNRMPLWLGLEEFELMFGKHYYNVLPKNWVDEIHERGVVE